MRGFVDWPGQGSGTTVFIRLITVGFHRFAAICVEQNAIVEYPVNESRIANYGLSRISLTRNKLPS